MNWVATPGHCRGWWEGQHRSLFSMWESNLPPRAPFRVKALDNFETVIVPSPAERRGAVQSATDDFNVKCTRLLGIEPTEWFPIERPTLDAEHFTFFISGGGHRKGSDLVIDAFTKVFDGRVPDGPAPRLFVHSAKASEFPKDDRIQPHHRQTHRRRRTGAVLNRSRLRPAFSAARALACVRCRRWRRAARPWVATNAHGHGAYGHLITYPLGWSMEETPAQAFHHGPAGSWWEPNFDDAAVEAMEDAYLELRVEACIKARVERRDRRRVKLHLGQHGHGLPRRHRARPVGTARRGAGRMG